MISEKENLPHKINPHSPGASASSTVDITLTEFTSWIGPHSVHAFSPKCKSANTAILNGAPARTRRFPLSGFVRSLTPVCGRRCGRSNPTVKERETRRPTVKMVKRERQTAMRTMRMRQRVPIWYSVAIGYTCIYMTVYYNIL